jgi:selenocysteine-specific elongation factor
VIEATSAPASFVLGTAGHVDHGKTTLVRALTGVDTDRFREEKERGLTIDIGFAHLDLDGLRLGIVDVPGHRDFIGNMLTGSTGLDAVLLVVSAAEGPMPQTREHLQIAELLGIRHGVVALTNVDRVDAGFAELAEEAVREELEQVLRHAAEWPVVRVDALHGDGVDDVRAALAALAGRLERPPPDPIFRLPVDRSFSVAGTGTVVTGTAWSGRVAIGDRLRVLPGAREVRVRSLQVHGAERDEVEARSRCAAGLVGVGVDDVGRGDTLVSVDDWSAIARIGAAVRLLPQAGRIIEHGTRIRVWLGTREVMARLELPGRGALAPGERSHAVLACEAPLVVRAGDRCILRFYSPVELLGGARVAELEPPASWESRTADWAAVLGGDPALSVAAAVRLAGGRGLDAGELRRAVPHPLPDPYPAGWAVQWIGERCFDPDLILALEDRLAGWLGRAHEANRRARSQSLESMRAAAGDVDPAVVDAAIGRLEAAERIAVEGPRVRLASHEVTLTTVERRVRDALLAAVQAEGLMPPPPDELAAGLQANRSLVNDLLTLLVDDGALVQVNPELYLSPEAEADLRAKALVVLAGREVARPTDFRDALNVTRRYLIPLLEYLDNVGWTRRTEEGRVAGPAAGPAAHG